MLARTALSIILSLAAFKAIAATPVTLKWAVTVDENGEKKRYEDKDLESFLKKSLELKGLSAKCDFVKKSAPSSPANETLNVTCIVGKDPLVVMTEAVCLKEKDFFVTTPFFLAKPKSQRQEKSTAIIMMSCKAQ